MKTSREILDDLAASTTMLLTEVDTVLNAKGLPGVPALIDAHLYAENSRRREEKAQERAREQAIVQIEGICSMVDALECDYARLEELQGEIDALTAAADDGTEVAASAVTNWHAENDEEVQALLEAKGECTDADDARERIEGDPLTIEVRSQWYSPGSDETLPEEFRILLCTGGPAVRIVGELDEHLMPCKAWIEHQDWWTPWTPLTGDMVDKEKLLTYCRQFYFGEK